MTRVFAGAAPLDENLAKACGQRLNCKVNQGYGMTEASPATHLVSDDIEWVKVGSIGPVVAGSECKVVDITTGEELGPQSDGEILIRGPQVMKGYLNNPAATTQILDDDGWLHTGDIGHADADGDFYVVDRLKELIKYKGYQVPPAELEAILLTHPAVADAAVIANPDEDAGEVPKAFVVLKTEAAPDELIQFVASRVAPHKKIRLVETIDEIRRTTSWFYFTSGPRIAEPANSTAYPLAPSAPIAATMASTMSLAETPGASTPSTLARNGTTNACAPFRCSSTLGTLPSISTPGRREKRRLRLSGQ